ncbi:prephenate dehydratase [Auraticoccus monumenti]|uniref:Prephenate dehydratase n=1 Tax=Auraticoccus monumenti TaxID=675864 RepID=A0A1G6SHR7_9ACTN|nr:prephenate dehydratase [Auraticoccus monumenti]SDD16181.1 prephenate dehydratase [Auraticoccus monumenti]
MPDLAGPTDPPTSYGYLGPAGTFTHQALLGLGLTSTEPRPYPSVPAALHAVRSGEVDAVLVPIENSVEGGVSATLDALTYGAPLVITREAVIDVQFDLYVRPGTRLEDVGQVITHPHAAAQCRGWLDAHLPAATVTERGSTAGAAVTVADPDSGYDAAICAPVAGRSQGLVAAAEAIADNPDAQTRFVLVSRPGELPPRTGRDKTTLVCFMRRDRSGALLEILDQFASRGVNLCRIESRPTRTTLGSYCFSIDAEGHLDDARLAEAVMGLHRICQAVVFLGSYTRADEVAPTVAAGHADDDYAEAVAWLASLRRSTR